MTISLDDIIEGHRRAGFDLVDDGDKACLNFVNGTDKCFHWVFDDVIVDSDHIVQDDQVWNRGLGDMLEAYFNTLLPGDDF